MRRAFAFMTALASTMALTAVVSPPAHAGTNVGNVNVTYDTDIHDYTVTPSTLTGAAGDTFTLTNLMTAGLTDYFTLVNGTGTARQGASNCVTSGNCAVYDNPGGSPISVTITIITPGTFTVFRNTGGSDDTAGTLTVTAPAASTPMYEITFDWSCSLPTAPVNTNSMRLSGGAQYALPTSCDTGVVKLLGWRQQGGSEFAPGALVRVADNTQWTAVVSHPSVQVTLDANVASADQCLNDAGVNAAPSQRTTSMGPVRSGDGIADLMPWRAACTPPGHTLVAWRATVAGVVTDCPTGSPTGGFFVTLCKVTLPLRQNSLTLVAVWKAT